MYILHMYIRGFFITWSYSTFCALKNLDAAAYVIVYPYFLYQMAEQNSLCAHQYLGYRAFSDSMTGVDVIKGF